MIQLNLVPLGVNFGGEDNNSYNLGGLMKLSKMPVVYFKCFWSICLSTPRLLEAGYAESMFFVHPRKILKIFSNIYFKFEISFSIKKNRHNNNNKDWLLWHMPVFFHQLKFEVYSVGVGVCGLYGLMCQQTHKQKE